MSLVEMMATEEGITDDRRVFRWCNSVAMIEARPSNGCDRKGRRIWLVRVGFCQSEQRGGQVWVAQSAMSADDAAPWIGRVISMARLQERFEDDVSEGALRRAAGHEGFAL